MNKLDLLNAVINQLETMLERAEQARRAAQADANSHLGRLQSRYDTFKEEAQYLAAAHEKRSSLLATWLRSCIELRTQLLSQLPPNPMSRTVGNLPVVQPGSMVTYCYYQDSSGIPSDPVTVFILPGGAMGERPLANQTVGLLSCETPLARSLLGHKQGDEVLIPLGYISPPNIQPERPPDAQPKVRAYIIEVT